MKKNISQLLFFLILCLVFSASYASAAEVYYFGNGSSPKGEKNDSYVLSQRVKDLYDFTSKRPLSERSGKISGSLLTQVEYDKVSGNSSKSFLKNGADYLTELNLNLQEKLNGNYNFEGQVMLRKTDNPRIEPRRDVRVKEYSLKISNPDNLFLFGDFYGELSPFTLGTSLEGLTAEVKPNDTVSMKYIVARRNDADEAASKYQRNVFGTKLDAVLFRNSEKISNARIGFQAVTSQDDSSTLERTSSLTDLNNSVFSIDGELSFIRFFSMNYEFARSLYLADEDSTSIKDRSNANAIHVAPQIQIGNTILRHNYNYTQPNFYTDAGSASPDRIQHQTTLDHRFNKRASVSLMHNYAWDHLTGSPLTKRTTTDEKSISLNLQPLANRETLRTRLFSSYNLKNSDDTGNSLESRTFTLGFAVTDQWRGADVGLNYEYRDYSNQADKSLSEYFNRFGFSFAKEYQLWARRLYLSLNPSVDIRRTKADTNSDLNFSVSFSGQYDAMKNMVARFGHNLIDSNNAGPDTDYINNRSFLECDWTVGKEKNMHIVLRGDVNRYMHEDGTLNYKEYQTILKWVLNF